jgi:chemotaxis methyl-accepting protein methylase
MSRSSDIAEEQVCSTEQVEALEGHVSERVANKTSLRITDVCGHEPYSLAMVKSLRIPIV